MLVSPQKKEGHPNSDVRGASRLISQAVVLNSKTCDETLFQLSYEYKPLNSSFDYRSVISGSFCDFATGDNKIFFCVCLRRIHLRTQSLDIVYNPDAVKWLSDFFTKPLHQSTDTNLRIAARQKYQAIKAATKNELIKNWEQILAGDLVRDTKFFFAQSVAVSTRKLAICAFS